MCVIHTGVVLAYIVSRTVAHTLYTPSGLAGAWDSADIFKGAATAFPVAYYIILYM